uniref:Uncharacterized protein n=1 Tax=Anopheles atroparvus TaxID=41427 RepID=A0AAG5CWC4_ANOAO
MMEKQTRINSKPYLIFTLSLRYWPLAGYFSYFVAFATLRDRILSRLIAHTRHWPGVALVLQLWSIQYFFLYARHLNNRVDCSVRWTRNSGMVAIGNVLCVCFFFNELYIQWFSMKHSSKIELFFQWNCFILWTIQLFECCTVSCATAFINMILVSLFALHLLHGVSYNFDLYGGFRRYASLELCFFYTYLF